MSVLSQIVQSIYLQERYECKCPRKWSVLCFSQSQRYMNMDDLKCEYVKKKDASDCLKKCKVKKR